MPKPFPSVFPLCLLGWEGECGQHGSEGADMPAFHHPVLTEDTFNTLSIQYGVLWTSQVLFLTVLKSLVHTDVM